jgi:flavin-dependent dehydrogenase
VYDACIIGGGPTGLATAIHARLKGLSVCLFEPKSGVIDKACGEGLMPTAVHHLKELGVEPEFSYPFIGIRYIDGHRQAEGRFRQGAGQGVRRLALHQALLKRAQELGVEFRSQSVRTISQEEDHVQVEDVQARYAIAADGLHSPIRRKLELGLPPKRRARLGLRRHYSIAPWSQFVEVYWSPQAEAYVTPVADDQVGVAILFYQDHAPPGEHKYRQLLTLFPELAQRLEGSEKSSHIRGAGPFEQRVSQGAKGRILLVGDAAGYLDPLTGEGIKLGLDGARAIVQRILEDDPKAYVKDCRRILRKYWIMTDGLLKLRQVPLLRRLMIPVLGFVPKLFDMVISALAAD